MSRSRTVSPAVPTETTRLLVDNDIPTSQLVESGNSGNQDGTQDALLEEENDRKPWWKRPSVSISLLAFLYTVPGHKYWRPPPKLWFLWVAEEQWRLPILTA